MSDFQSYHSASLGSNININYLKSVSGILKVVEIVLSLLVVICASVFPRFVPLGGGWVLFVSVSALVLTLVLFVSHILNVITRIPHTVPRHMLVLSMMVFVAACIVSPWGGQGFVQGISVTAFLSALALFLMHMFGLIARFPGPWQFIEFVYYVIFTVFYLIVAIISATNGGLHSSIVACAFFAFGATAMYGVDTFFQFRSWQAIQTGSNVGGTTTSHVSTVTASNMESGGWHQY